MSTATRVFVARLAGIGVFDPSGDQIGRVRDAVTALRIDRQPPRVLGLVIEVQQRHRIFVPMGRVTRIEPDQVVLTSGTVNMKRFERRSNETLVLAELLDRTVTLRDTGQPVVIVDLAMEQNRVRDWVLSRLAIRTTAPRLTRRRGQLSQVEWNEVDGLAVPETNQGTDALLSTLSDLRAADVAHALHDMPDKRRMEVVRALDDERLADVLQEMEEDDQVIVLSRARGRARRRRPRGDGRRRRGRPARRDVSRRPAAPARTDGARGRRAGAPADDLRRHDGRRHDDLRAGDPAPRCHRRRSARARAQSGTVAGDSPRRCSWCAHRRRRPPASSWAPRICSGCCASRRRRW